MKTLRITLRVLVLLVALAGGYLFWASNTSVTSPTFATRGMGGGAPRMEMAESLSLSSMADGGIVNRSMKMASADMSAGSVADESIGGPIDPKVIKNGSLTLQVESPEDGRYVAEQEVGLLGGSVTNISSWNVRTNVLAYRMTLRVPSEELENLMLSLEKLGTKTGESFTLQDVTEQYTDNEARIESLEKLRAQYEKLLERDSNEIAQLVQLTREINNVQQQIERLQNRNQQTDRQVAFSTLQLTLNPVPQIGDIDPTWSVDASTKTAWNKFQENIRKAFDALLGFAAGFPLWAPALLILFIVWKLISRIGNKKEQPASAMKKPVLKEETPKKRSILNLGVLRRSKSDEPDES